MKQILSFLLLLTSVTVFSQDLYKPGYFIDNLDNKTPCLIQDIAWKNSPVEFGFKRNDNTESETGYIIAIKEFGVDGSYIFRRFEVNIDYSSNYIKRMNEVKGPQWKKETLFLRVLIEGPLNLYQYEDGDGVKYFYSSGDHTQPEQLFHKKYVIEGQLGENNYYRQQLFNLMKDKISDPKKFEKLEYERSFITKLFKEYNGAEAKDHTKNHNKGNLDLKITPGVNFASLSFKNSVNTAIDFDFEKKASFLIGAEVEYILPIYNSKWSLFTNPNVQSYKNTFTKGYYTFDVDYTMLDVPVGVRHYMFLGNDSKLFVNASYSFIFSLNDSYFKYNDTTPLEISKTGALSFGAGYCFDRYSAEVRYTVPRDILNEYTTWNANYSTVGIILGIRIL